jgi:CDP-glucose 4,6-dehydratase
LIARCYWPSFELPVAVTRFANVYGGADTNRSRLVPESICAALAGVAPRIRSDGSPERDFLYVEDAASAYIALWAALGRGEGRGEAFNGGSGRCWSVREVVSLICRLTDSAVEPAWGGPGSPPGEIDRQWVDATRLTEVTGWRPTVSLEDGLQRTIDWYRAHPAMWKGS